MADGIDSAGVSQASLRARQALGICARNFAFWMSAQVLADVDGKPNAISDLRRIGAPASLFEAGNRLHVALHQLAAELGQPSAVPPWPGRVGLHSAALEVAGQSFLAAAIAVRWAGFMQDRQKPSGGSQGDGGSDCADPASKPEAHPGKLRVVENI